MAKKKPDNHYIDNEEFYQAMIEWKKVVKEAEEAGEGKPPVTDYIGECFMKIAEHLSYRPNFINYPFREEMVGDGIENCLMYCTNFDPEKSKNPFSYFTQIIYYAFLRRIQKEKKQTFIKYKAIQVAMDRGLINQANMGMHFFDPDDASDPVARYLELSENDIEKFDKTKKKKETKPKPVKDEPFDPFMETTDEDSDSK